MLFAALSALGMSAPSGGWSVGKPGETHAQRAIRRRNEDRGRANRNRQSEKRARAGR